MCNVSSNLGESESNSTGDRLAADAGGCSCFPAFPALRCRCWPCWAALIPLMSSCAFLCRSCSLGLGLGTGWTCLRADSSADLRLPRRFVVIGGLDFARILRNTNVPSPPAGFFEFTFAPVAFIASFSLSFFCAGCACASSSSATPAS